MKRRKQPLNIHVVIECPGYPGVSDNDVECIEPVREKILRV